MGQSLVQNYMHIVFSTKNLADLIIPKYETALYKYIGGTCKELGSLPFRVGGYRNHVHILCSVSRTISVSHLCQKIKANSSRWYKSNDPLLKDFYWQDGYGAFSVSPSHVPRVVNYIENQHGHHKKTSFKEEYLGLLKKYDLDFDENFLW